VGHMWSEHYANGAPDVSAQHATEADGAPQLPPSASAFPADS
jgi:hypothetical protein